MNITFEDLRKIKHSLPHGSITRIASELSLTEDTVRDFFGGGKYHATTNDWHMEPGPSGGIVSIQDTKILDLANKILQEN